MSQMMTPMRKMPAPRMHTRMMPATFVASGLVTTAAFMMTATGDDGMNRIDDTARCCRALRRTLGPAACIIAAARGVAHAAAFMATHAAVTAATATATATARKCTVGGNGRDAQGTGKRQHPQHRAERP
jgi:hypothetical protein